MHRQNDHQARGVELQVCGEQAAYEEEKKLREAVIGSDSAASPHSFFSKTPANEENGLKITRGPQHQGG